MFTSLGEKGISTYTKRLVNEMPSLDSNLTVEIVGLQESFLIRMNPFRYIQGRRLYKKLGENMNRGDIAHIQHEYSLFCLWTNPFENMYKPFRKRIKKPVVITVHELEERKKSKTLLKRLIKIPYYKIFFRYLRYVNAGMFQECDAVIVHTEEARQTLIGRGVDQAKINFIPHGIPLVNKSKKSVEEDKRTYGVDGKVVLMTWGYISYRKGQDLIIDILAKLPEHVVYIIAGGVSEQEKHFSSYYTSLLEKINTAGLSDRVIFTGSVSDADVKYIMNAADIVISPAREMTASGSLSESIGYEKVILAANLPFMQEIYEAIPCIRLFPAGESNGLLKELMWLLDNPSSWHEYSKKAGEYKELASFKNAAEKTVAIYNAIEKKYGRTA